jgi:GT2 family glycosyltransferase
MAHVEIFILNFNGARHLPACLESVAALDRGGHSVGVSVVDNASSDDSEEIVREYPGVHFIPNGENLGFSAGNNRGVEKRLRDLRAAGREVDYLCFLNNDTAVEPRWLCAAIERFATDERIGIVGSKSLFFDHFIPLEISLGRTERPNRERQTQRSRDDDPVFLGELEGCSNIEREPNRSKWIGWGTVDPKLGRKIKSGSRLLLPVTDPQKSATFELVFNRLIDSTHTETVVVNCGAERHEVALTRDGPGSVVLRCAPADYRSVIQNAGSFVLPSWEAGDIGMYALDDRQFDTPREVAAVCGVSLFIRRNVFESLGGFDEKYFAYYEDTDLSLRCRMHGHTCWYEPSSVLRHLHCGSSGEHSPYFDFNVTRSHLLFTARWMSPRPFRRKIAAMIRSAWHELKLYADDQNLETKPNLRTICQTIKRPGYVLAARRFERHHRRAIAELPSPPDSFEPETPVRSNDTVRTREAVRAI